MLLYSFAVESCRFIQLFRLTRCSLVCLWHNGISLQALVKLVIVEMGVKDFRWNYPCRPSTPWKRWESTWYVKEILNNIVSNLLVISWSLETLAHMSNSFILVSPHCTKVLYSKWLCSSSQAPWERICNQQGHDPWVWIHGNRAFEDMAPPLVFPPLGHHLQWTIIGLFGFADWVMRRTFLQHQPPACYISYCLNI